MSKKKERINKLQEERPGIYNSTAYPKHFENEGGEKIEQDTQRPDDNNNMAEEVDFDKITGKKKE